MSCLEQSGDRLHSLGGMKCTLALAALALAAAGHAITLGQLDTFTSGFDSWTGSSPTLAMGGPGGAADQFLRLQSGSGFSPKMAARNSTQWAGNYTSAGVDSVALQVANVGSTSISLRVALFGSASQEFTSTSAQTILPDGLWRSFTFSLGQADLTSVGSNNDYSGMMGGVTNFMFRHNPGSPSGSGSQPNYTGVMGIDNVSAVPEPSSLLAIALGLGLLRRRR